MRKIYKLFPLLLLPIAIVFLGNSGGSIGGKTGSIGDGGTSCTQCHSGVPQNATTWVTTNIPPTGYVPGQTYTITATGTHTGALKFGFELTAENSTGGKVGNFVITNATQTKLTNSNKAVTHTAGGNTPSGGTKTWSMNWTAPTPAVGPVKFSAAFNAANGNGNNTGDVIYLASTTVQAATLVDVTFRVDMSEQTVSPNGVHLAGNFQGWNPATTLMTHQGNNIYAVTIGLAPGFQAQYKFINGTTWAQVESVPVSCSLPPDNNRYFTVPNEPLILPAVCFSSCNPCSINVSITFQVDMSEQTVSPLGVHVAGSFQGWNPGSTLLTHQGNNVYAVTVLLPPGETYQYKFVNGNAWGMDESVPAGCAQGGNRYFTVPAQNYALPVVCFGSCVPCVVPLVDVTFQVDMTYQTVSPDGVHIAGSFQGWDPAASVMTLVSDNIYAATFNLEVGNSYEYKFINGNEWGEDETVPVECAVNNNRVLTVPAVNTTLLPVCYEMCDECPDPVEVSITFQVDMSEQIVSPSGVHIAGTFNNFSPSATPMTLQGNNIYAVTLTLTQNENHLYRFVNGNTNAGLESVPSACAQNGQRHITVPGEDLVLDEVCFSSCEACVPPPIVDVTFRVDMSDQTVSADGVHLVGSFQGWNLTGTPMTLAGDGIYAVTLPLVGGDHHTYKFINGISWDFSETVPAECGEDNGLGGYNRFIDVPDENIILEAVCFSSCEVCPPPAQVNVTFQVDMSEQTVSPLGVHLAGSFQGWNYGSTPMTHIGNNVYWATVTLTEDDYHTYRFVNGNIKSQSELVPPACAVGNPFSGYNRYFTVSVLDTLLPLVCYASCDPCVPPVTADVTFRVDMSGVFVSPDGVHLAGSFQGWDPAATAMTAQGNGIYAVTINLLAGEAIQYKFVNGNEWGEDEAVPEECALNGNRFLTVPDVNTVLDAVCYGSCTACPPLVEITFQVDMAYQTVSPEGVHVAGSFQGWNPASTAMTLSHDAVYSYSISLPQGYYYEYKFINGNVWEGAETVPAGCAQNNNRFITIPEANQMLDPVCFGSCTVCAPPTVEITFQVDMTNELISPDGVHIAGSFQGWDPASTAMTDAGDNIYTYTTSLNIGEYYEFKYINGNSWDGAENVPGECSQNGNRYLTVPAENTTLDLVCFGGCSSCPTLVAITFQVDMRLQEVSANGVHLVGDFQGWNPEGTPMLAGDDGIYSAEVVLEAGTYQTYKFINGNTFDGVEIVPQECGVDDGFGGFKRFLDVPLANTVLEAVCFGQCSGCAVQHNIVIQEGWQSLSSYVMPAETDIEALLSDIYPELVVLQTMSGIYFPAGGLNTIGTWEPQSAYKIKVSQEVTLTIVGLPEQNKTLQLAEGWNLIPVISENPVDVLSLFGSLGNDVIVIKAIADIGVYWPQFDINTLVTLQPGKAYFVKMAAPGSVTFP